MTDYDNWKPTADGINSLPEKIKEYVFRLETLCDPQYTIAENIFLKDELYMFIKALEIKQKEDNMLMEQILQEIDTERIKQYRKGFNFAQDDEKTVDDWFDDITAYLTWAKLMYKMSRPEKYRKRMLQASAMTVACLESFDRYFNQKEKDGNVDELLQDKFDDYITESVDNQGKAHPKKRLFSFWYTKDHSHY